MSRVVGRRPGGVFIGLRDAWREVGKNKCCKSVWAGRRKLTVEYS